MNKNKKSINAEGLFKIITENMMGIFRIIKNHEREIERLKDKIAKINKELRKRPK